jgi:hypothetical protein
VHDFPVLRARAHVSRRGRQRSQDDLPNNKRLIPLCSPCPSSAASVTKMDRCLDHLRFRPSRARVSVAKKDRFVRRKIGRILGLAEISED